MIFRFVYLNSMPFYGVVKAVHRGAGRARHSAREDALRFHSVKGLAPIVCAGALAALGVAGCASGPIDMVRAEAEAPRVLEEQAALRDGAQALAHHVEEAGWSVAPPAADQARSFLGRLIGGDSEPAVETDPVAVYLEGATLARIAGHIEELAIKARAVSGDAYAVAAAPQGLSRQALQRDIAAAESALGAVRRARAFFVEVGARVSAPEDAVAQGLDELKSAETALAEAADALAERRWSGHGEPLSG